MNTGTTADAGASIGLSGFQTRKKNREENKNSFKRIDADFSYLGNEDKIFFAKRGNGEVQMEIGMLSAPSFACIHYTV